MTRQTIAQRRLFLHAVAKRNGMKLEILSDYGDGTSRYVFSLPNGEGGIAMQFCCNGLDNAEGFCAGLNAAENLRQYKDLGINPFPVSAPR